MDSYSYNTHNAMEGIMIIGFTILALAALAGITGTVVSTAHDGYRRQPTRSFDK